MVRILLLDCSDLLEQKLKAQGFNVESGTAGFCTGIRKLPSQIYEKDVIIYDPTSAAKEGSKDFQVLISPDLVKDATPQYSLTHLQSRIEGGATFLVFVNRLSDHIKIQEQPYKWIPFMPPIQFTSDKIVGVNRFDEYPDWEWKILAPIVTTDGLDLPVLQKLFPPTPQDYPRDVFHLFGNGNGDSLGVLILRGRGRLIVLPKFKSNESMIEAFLHYVVPSLYTIKTKTGLIEMFSSPAERISKEKLKELRAFEEKIQKRQEAARIDLATSTREKSNVINADETAKQILIYYDEARKQPNVALFYLYKILESIENKFGGEAAGIAAVGAKTEWKSVKKLANESYRDARHAPKPTDVIKQWSQEEIKKCFEDTEKVIVAYFMTLFPTSEVEPAGGGSGSPA